MDISDIIENVERMFTKRFFNVIEYDNSKIICKEDDFDLRIIDYIEDTFNVVVEYGHTDNLDIIIKIGLV